MKRTLITVFIWTGSALLATADIAQAQTLGRLFSTPQQRREIDAHRGAKPMRQPIIKLLPALKPGPTTETSPAYAPPPPPRPSVINGFVRRSDGPSTVWLNEKPISGNAAREEWLQPSAVNSPVRVQNSTR
jgi:hypothetical protein